MGLTSKSATPNTSDAGALADRLRLRSVSTLGCSASLKLEDGCRPDIPSMEALASGRHQMSPPNLSPSPNTGLHQVNFEKLVLGRCHAPLHRCGPRLHGRGSTEDLLDPQSSLNARTSDGSSTPSDCVNQVLACPPRSRSTSSDLISVVKTRLPCTPAVKRNVGSVVLELAPPTSTTTP